ncbi:hypothetical protein ACFL59_07850 [Planctomycetota bacterium]
MTQSTNRTPPMQRLLVGHLASVALVTIALVAAAIGNVRHNDPLLDDPVPTILGVAAVALLFYCGLLFRLDMVRWLEQVVLILAAAVGTPLAINSLWDMPGSKRLKAALGLVIMWFFVVRVVRELRSRPVRICFGSPPANPVRQALKDAGEVAAGLGIYALFATLFLLFALLGMSLYSPGLRASWITLAIYVIVLLIGSLVCALGLLTGGTLLVGRIRGKRPAEETP